MRISFVSTNHKSQILKIVLKVNYEGEKYFSQFIQSFVQDVLIENTAQIVVVFITPNDDKTVLVES